MLIPKPIRIIFPCCVAGAAVGFALAKMKPFSVSDCLIAGPIGLFSYVFACFVIDALDQLLRRITRDPIYVLQNAKRDCK